LETFSSTTAPRLIENTASSITQGVAQFKTDSARKFMTLSAQGEVIDTEIDRL